MGLGALLDFEEVFFAGLVGEEKGDSAGDIKDSEIHLLFAYYNNFGKVNLIMSCIKSKASYPQIN